MKISRFLLPAALGLICLTSTSFDAHAAVIAWGAATNIVGDTDVSTVGTLDRAINWGGNNTTVNGVTFLGTGGINNTASYNFQNTTLSSPATLGGSGGLGANGSLSTSYQDLISSAAYANISPQPMTVTLGALTVGQNYQVQIWVNDSRSVPGGSRSETVNGGGNSVLLDYNNTNADGGVGQWTIGSFLADSTSQAFTLTGGSTVGNPAAQINGLQLRSTVATPEPATWAMMAMGLCAMGLMGWKRKKSENGSAA